MQIQLEQKIKNKSAEIAVIGLGYVGLPLAVELAKRGFHVTGIDTDRDRVSKVKKAVPYILDVDVQEIKKIVKRGFLTASADFRRLHQADVIIICVPTPLKRKYQPNINYIKQAVRKIKQQLRKGQLIILESTTYPGTTDEVILPMLESTGLKCGEDFFLVFSPERIDPGNKKFPLAKIPKVVGGVTEGASDLFKLLYEQIIEKVVVVSSPRAAETVKLLENTFRLVNIGLVNELGMMCHKMNLDIWEIIDAARTKPFGFMPFYPGPGVGGHCLDKNENVFIKDGECFKVMKMPEVIRYIQKEDSQNNIEILSFDPLRRKSIFRKINAVSARPYSGDMVSISTKDGRHLKVTDLHPMFILHLNKLRLKYAKDLQIGDKLPVCLKLLNYNLNPIQTRITKEIGFVRVQNISVVSANRQMVYSLETEKPHAFITSYGIAVHNCIPKDPLYLYWKAKMHGFKSRFIKLAANLNSAMPAYIVERLSKIITIGKAKILILGVTYKKDVKDLRKSPALEIIDLLRKNSAYVFYADPLIPYLKFNHYNLKAIRITAQALAEMDCCLLITDHSGFDYEFILQHSRLIFDTRNAYYDRKADNLIRL